MHRIVSLVIVTLLVAGCLAPGEQGSASPTPNRAKALPMTVYKATWNAPQDSPTNDTFQLDKPAALDVAIQPPRLAEWDLTIRGPDGVVAFRDRCDMARTNCSVEPVSSASYPAGTYRVEWSSIGVGAFHVWVNASEPNEPPATPTPPAEPSPTPPPAKPVPTKNRTLNETLFEARWRAPADSPKNVTFRLHQKATLGFSSEPNGTLLSYNLTILDPDGNVAFQDVCGPLAPNGCAKSVVVPANGTSSRAGTYRILWSAAGIGEHHVLVTVSANATPRSEVSTP